jgi:N-acetyl-anhydromuramyl-L-alanine amidase AmpD
VGPGEHGQLHGGQPPYEPSRRLRDHPRDTSDLLEHPGHLPEPEETGVRALRRPVGERDVAWHAGNWDYNTRSIGIEHEGWVDKPAYFTNAMYEESAKLTAAICAKYAIPKDRSHILAHYEVPGSDHTDPGPNWDWTRYMRLVNFA